MPVHLPREGQPPSGHTGWDWSSLPARPPRGREHRFVVIGALLEIWVDFDPFLGRTRPIFPPPTLDRVVVISPRLQGASVSSVVAVLSRQRNASETLRVHHVFRARPFGYTTKGS